MSIKKDTVIIGGGFAGLSAAYKLLKHGIKPLIIEKEAFLGGMASCYKIENFWIEKFYHHFFTHDSEAVALAKELGNGNDLIWNKSRMAFFSNNKLYGFTTPLDLLRFSEIGFLDRLKVGLFRFLARKNGSCDELDSLSAEEWLNGKIGSSAYRKIVAPILKSKFGLHIDDISAAFIMGRIEARSQSRTKFLSRETFGYYRGGLQNFISALHKSISSLGGDIKLNAEVEEIIVKDDSNFVIKTAQKESIHCKDIVVTVPMPIINKLITSYADINPNLAQFNYMPVVCLCAGIKEKLSNYYWINIASEEIPFGLVVEHTNFVPVSFYNGMQIVYLSGYCDISSPLFKMSEEEIFDYYMNGLKKIFPSFSDNKVLWWKVSKEPFATPVFARNFNKLLFQLKAKLPKGFYLAGNILAYPQSKNVNNAIKSGINAAEEIISDYGLKESVYKHCNTC
ncbi:MAG: NAD(P)/FAD-dependent oxidoreductase [bacterium]